ncbi:MAG: 50S ribosomal protein L9 [Gammaproteobacteria bacterium]|nr:50S ribosomal protein L9 [Gammaproteobacteria bacterium]
MELILLEKVANLGNIGDRVRVKPGFGRNFLLPQGKAAPATPENIAALEARRADLERRQSEQLGAAHARKTQLEALALRLTAKAGSEGKLFGSLGTVDIAEACSTAGVAVERSEVRLPAGPIRVVGEHIVTIHLHTDVDVDLKIEVVAEDAASA